METTAKGLSTKTVVIAAMVIVVVVTAAAAAIVLNVMGKEEPSSGIGYATNATVILTQEELQAAMAEAAANAKNGSIALEYKNDAYSTDGSTFDCYILNSGSNAYDMFLTICSNIEMTDQLFLSQLVPPGSGFNKISLERPLEPGDHTVYVALTQVDVDEETGEEFIRGQVVHTMEFHVTKG